jgi:DNA-binding GntR family transcriptional regulator
MPMPAREPPFPVPSKPARTAALRVYGELRALLIAGMLEPGAKVSLRTMAARLGVSVQPVREAVSRLVADRALVVLPNRAVRVPLLTRPQFRELTAIRLVVEGYAAERAAANRTPAQLAAMRRHDAAFRREHGHARPNGSRAIAHNQALHFAVYRAAGLAELVPIIEGLWLRIGPVLNFDMRGADSRLRMVKSESCHARLVAAIGRGDAAGARRALTSDITGAAKHIEARGVLPPGTLTQRGKRDGPRH